VTVIHGHWTCYIFFVNTESLHHYVTKFTFQQDGVPAHRASETVQLLKQMTRTRLHTTNTVTTQQPRPKPRGLCSAGDYAGASLQEEDHGRR